MEGLVEEKAEEREEEKVREGTEVRGFLCTAVVGLGRSWNAEVTATERLTLDRRGVRKRRRNVEENVIVVCKGGLGRSVVYLDVRRVARTGPFESFKIKFDLITQLEYLETARTRDLEDLESFQMPIYQWCKGSRFWSLAIASYYRGAQGRKPQPSPECSSSQMSGSSEGEDVRLLYGFSSLSEWYTFPKLEFRFIVQVVLILITVLNFNYPPKS